MQWLQGDNSSKIKDSQLVRNMSVSVRLYSNSQCSQKNMLFQEKKWQGKKKHAIIQDSR